MEGTPSVPCSRAAVVGAPLPSKLPFPRPEAPPVSRVAARGPLLLFSEKNPPGQPEWSTWGHLCAPHPQQAALNLDTEGLGLALSPRVTHCVTRCVTLQGSPGIGALDSGLCSLPPPSLPREQSHKQHPHQHPQNPHPHPRWALALTWLLCPPATGVSPHPGPPAAWHNAMRPPSGTFHRFQPTYPYLQHEIDLPPTISLSDGENPPYPRGPARSSCGTPSSSWS